MAEKTLKSTIEELLKADKFDADQAVDIYLKYGPNKNMARHFIRAPKRYEGKLRWELSKMIGISLREFNGQAGNSQKGLYPPIIDRIKNDLQQIMKDQAELQKKLTELGDANDEKTKEQAVEYGKLIDVLAFRFDQLAKAKEKYFDDGTVPDDKELYPKNEDDQKDKKDPFGLKKMKPGEVVKRRSNLVTGITKDQNKLTYQSPKKLEQENPMPEGEERKKVEDRLAKKKEEVEAIDAFLEESGKEE